MLATYTTQAKESVSSESYVNKSKTRRDLATCLNTLMERHHRHKQQKLNPKSKGAKCKDGNKRNKLRRKRMRRKKTLQPLILQHSPSRDIKHFLSGSPISKRNNTTSSSLLLPQARSSTSQKKMHKIQRHITSRETNKYHSIGFNHIILLIDTNVNFTANQHEQIKRTIESGLPLPFIYKKRSIFGNTNVLSSSFPTKTSRNIHNYYRADLRHKKQKSRQNSQRVHGNRVKVRLRYKPDTVPGHFFGGTNDEAAFCELLCPSTILNNRE